MGFNHGSLFSGIGGFDLAAKWMNWNNVFQVEKDPFCISILKKNFPNTKIYEEIREFEGSWYNGKIDIISGGFPCQPFSVGGKRKGRNDDRYLWPEMFRIIQQIKPAWVVGENVSNIANMENGEVFETICNDLESEGYKVQAFDIPAASVGALHKRFRLWILAYAHDYNHRTTKQRGAAQKNGGKDKEKKENLPCGIISGTSKIWLPYKGYEQYKCTIAGPGPGYRWETEPGVGRMVNGISKRLDRLKSLGNAVVPQLVYEIFKIIDQFNKLHSE